VDQISLPMRIALAASLAFAALWFVALRPKPIEDVDAPVPVAQPAKSEGVTGAAKTAEKAAKTDATPTSKADAARADAKPAAKAKTAVRTAKSGPKAVVADVKAGRTVVLLFWDPKGASTDDRAVRRAVAKVDRHSGAVKVHVADVDQLQGYDAITNSAPVQETPTVLVIDRKARAHTIAGLTVTREIDALVDRALDVR
jgi:hypothetical protein